MFEKVHQPRWRLKNDLLYMHVTSTLGPTKPEYSAIDTLEILPVNSSEPNTWHLMLHTCKGIYPPSVNESPDSQEAVQTAGACNLMGNLCNSAPSPSLEKSTQLPGRLSSALISKTATACSKGPP
mmetsp:Transcript_153271/g.266640  ORF Transcript_153271/g.266640 Transcript_153271/m.266640 type:complete len:125 (-) Transcript_153271:388-762(-)